jgi:hypothetical protein
MSEFGYTVDPPEGRIPSNLNVELQRVGYVFSAERSTL